MRRHDPYHEHHKRGIKRQAYKPFSQGVFVDDKKIVRRQMSKVIQNLVLLLL